MIDGERRYTVALRTSDRYRENPEEMRTIPLRAPSGEQLTLDQVARSKSPAARKPSIARKGNVALL